MPIPMRSKFQFNTSDVFATSLSTRAWTPGDSTVGGSRVSSAGIPAAYQVRRDALLTLPLRIDETEWPDFLALIAFGQSGQPFDWFPDADGGSGYTVYLEQPAMGDRWAPTRMSEFPQTFDVTITLRGAGGAPWQAYF